MDRSRVTNWESKCLKCGLCCHQKTVTTDQVIYDLSDHCEHFDPKTKLCKIYLTRLEETSYCKRVTRFKAMFASYLPDSCGYVEWARSKGLRFAKRKPFYYIGGDRGCSCDEDPLSHTLAK